MEKLKTRVRKLGDSFGIILPEGIVNSERLKDGAEITITIESDNHMRVRDLIEFTKKQKLHKVKKDAQQIIHEIDKDLWGDE